MLAWNGIRFSCPRHWEVTGIRDRYMLLEDGDGPVLDLRWERTPENVSAETGLALLRKRSRKTGLVIDEPDRLPADSSLIRHNDPTVETAPFSWSTRTGNTQGVGCMLRFPASSMTVVARFHREPTHTNLAAAAELCSSLACFAPSQTIPWQLYDVGFELPGTFSLKSFSLQPGHYRFIFENGDSRLIMDRVGPASVVLKELSLETWVTGFHSLAKTKTYELRPASNGENSLEWIARRKGDLIPARGLSRLLPLTRFCRGRVWLPPHKNMLLCVTMTDKTPPDDTLFTEVCSSYVLV